MSLVSTLRFLDVYFNRTPSNFLTTKAKFSFFQPIMKKCLCIDLSKVLYNQNTSHKNSPEFLASLPHKVLKYKWHWNLLLKAISLFKR